MTAWHKFTTLFAAAIMAVACSKSFPPAIKALAESWSAVAIPSDDTAKLLPHFVTPFIFTIKGDRSFLPTSTILFL